MEAEHTGIAEAVERVQALRLMWATSADPRVAGQLAVAADDLSARLHEHLGDEERSVVPLIKEHIMPEEWAEALERGGDFLKSDMRMGLVYVGFMLQDASPTEQQRFLAGVPRLVRLLWRLFGKRTFDAYRTDVYGSAAEGSLSAR